MKEDVTVLIANIGRIDNLLNCLRSLSGAFGSCSHRVVVGFNFSGENDSPRLLAHQFPEVEQLYAPARLGYCRAYNQLMSHRSGRYTLLLDDDTVLGPGSVEEVVRFMDKNPKVAVAGCRTVNSDGSYQKTTAATFGFRTEAHAIFRPNSFWRDGVDEATTEWKCVQWLNSHFLLMRSDAIDEIGDFDDFFYTSVLEADWCLRARKAGWQVAYVPQAQVMHIGGSHSIQPGVKTYENLVQMYINRYYFFRKHYGDVAVLGLRPLVSAAAFVRILNYMALWSLSSERRREAKIKISAYWRVLLLGVARRPDALPDGLQRLYQRSGEVLRHSIVR